jgi:hypothetical protein
LSIAPLSLSMFGIALLAGKKARGRRPSSIIAGQPQEIQDEIIRINTDARPRALQLALLVPILAGLLGLANSFRMMRLPDPTPSGSVEGMALV